MSQQRCSDYWIFEQAGVKAEKENSDQARAKLLELQEHLHGCHQCRLWWIEMKEILESGG
jgi:hypothetical protein